MNLMFGVDNNLDRLVLIIIKIFGALVLINVALTFISIFPVFSIFIIIIVVVFKIKNRSESNHAEGNNKKGGMKS